MDEEDRPSGFGGTRAGLARASDAAHALSGESLDGYSQDELDTRLALLAAEAERVRAHQAAAGAHRLAAEALFRRPGA